MFFPTVLKRMHVPSKMHHQVLVQTKLPLNFPVPSPKPHENPLLLKKKCAKKIHLRVCRKAEAKIIRGKFSVGDVTTGLLAETAKVRSAILEAGFFDQLGRVIVNICLCSPGTISKMIA